MSELFSEFVIRPNSTYHRRSWPWVFALLVLVSLSIGIRFAMLGYWMILPFAILDMLAVGLVLWLLTRQSAYVEKVRVDNESVTIRHIQKRNSDQWRFPLSWTRVNLQAPSHPWYNNKLLIGSKGKWIEIGRCLTDAERTELARAIKEEITLRDKPLLTRG